MHTMSSNEVLTMAAQAAVSRPMTLAQFRSYWLGCDEGESMSRLDLNEESLGEHEAQYGNECAMFGDAGPGQGLRIREMRGELSRVRRVLGLGR